jgi:4-hydroxybenzoate polyprenyltransferase
MEQQHSALWLSLIKALRPKQWTKNFLVFASAMFAGTLLQASTFVQALVAFAAFSLMSSAIYVLNDLRDREQDRLHPDKRLRPIASGAVTAPQAIMLGVIAFAGALALGATVNKMLLVILLVYFVSNLLYSFYLKHVVILDVMLIAWGFVLRAVAGAVAVDGKLTSWFLLCTMALSLFLALGKRRHEFRLFEHDPGGRRKVLDDYSTKLLDQLMVMATSLVIMFYSMYAATEDGRMMFTVPFVLYGIFRYYYLIHMRNSGGKPEDVLLSDRHIQLTVLLFAVAVIMIKQL